MFSRLASQAIYQIPRVSLRNLHTTSLLSQESVFSKVLNDQKIEEKPKGLFDDVPETQKLDQAGKILPQYDEELIKYYQEKHPSYKVLENITPLKKQLYELNIQQNGFFKNKQTLTLDGKKYKLTLTAKEMEYFEPSVFVQSYRIKSSIKKTTIVNRLLNKMNALEAITQCHFSPKSIAKDIGVLLETGVKNAEELGYNKNSLYIDQLWVGSDGNWQKMIDIKGRGRHGIITRPWVHVKVILKTDITKKRLDWEKTQKDSRKKPWLQLNNTEPVRGSTGGVYKW